MSADKPRLLILDDDPDIRALVADAAVSLGFEVESTDRSESFDTQAFQRFDVVALDLMMPNRDGIEVLREMSGGNQPSIILISGLHEKLLRSARQIADANGLRVSATLRKPFRIAELRAALRLALESQRGASDQTPGGSAGGAAPGAAPGARFEPTAEDFRLALQRHELVVHFQPQVRIGNRRWTGVEVLVRWQHPEHGLLSPAAFIKLAEQPLFARSFTEEVLHLALSEARLIAQQTGFEGDVSVNLPPSAMTDVSLTEQVLEFAIRDGFPPQRLILELTETSIPRDLGVALDIATRLRMRGVRLSIDDFGIGWSSLERLESAPFDELKIDMSFVRHATKDASARAIIENATRLGHDLRMTVVAEGVEDLPTFELLRSLGCDVAQGYFIARPMAASDLCAWAIQHRHVDAHRAGRPAVAAS